MAKFRSTRRYAIAGMGNRAEMCLKAGVRDHAEFVEFVAWCDSKPGRMRYYDSLLEADGVAQVNHYRPDELEEMIDVENVDVVIVTSPDFTHAEIVTRALRAGADVVVEKPLTT